jgi:NADH-quinone oxidoreductase B subunit
MGLLNYFRQKSPWILHYNTGACNGCDIEVVASLTPRYDVERLGIVKKGSPRHADILLVTGVVTRQSKDSLLRIYEQIPEPKVVVAVGNCPISNCVFNCCYNVVGPLDKHVPVDVYVPGCPPMPEAIIDGVLKVIPRLKR